ncbi:MAG: hypothetical protein L6U99_12430 [Clostridium sp.]|nr:MAG: hypothetical protein L6U99_12430 [Clostridium sp.]
MIKNAKAIFDSLNTNIAQILIVSKVEFLDGEAFNVKVSACDGCTCQRCRMIVPKLFR